MKKIVGIMMLVLFLLVFVPLAFAETQTASTQDTLLMAIVVALLAISEVLAFIPSIKANSVFQLIVNFIERLAEKKGTDK